jgi:hypothetical protein
MAWFLYVEIPKSHKKLLGIVNEFNKIVGYEIAMPKSIVFLCTNNKLHENKIKKIIPFTIESKLINIYREVIRDERFV